MGNQTSTSKDNKNKTMGNTCNKETSAQVTTTQQQQQQQPTARRHYRESVLDITGKPLDSKKPGQASEQGGATGQLRAKNIFAAPVKISEDFVFPNYDKSDEDRKFIELAVQDNFIFAGVETAELANLINAFQSYTASNREQIITEGETGDFFYILQSGSVTFTVNGGTVGEAGAGSCFGDLALLYDCPRAATCTAVGACKLWRVDQSAFRQILANTTLNKDKAVLDTLRKVSFLKELEIEYLHKIANAVETKKFKSGTKIVNKGEQGLEFFVLKEGKVSVEDIEVGGRKYENQVYGPGDFFGERAIVKEEPRAANVVATEDVTVLSLSREKFLEVVGPLEDLIKKTEDLRMLKGIPAFARSDVKAAEYKALAARIVFQKVKSGHSFYSKDETDGGGIYFLHSGKVTAVDNKEITQGGYFGVNDTVLPEKNTSNAVAVTDCEVGYLSKDAIIAIIVQLERIYEGAKRRPLQRLVSNVNSEVVPYENLKKHRVLGVGTFGKVWLVTNGDSKEAFALKVQRKRILLQHSQVEGVLREMKVMSKLDHPFVLKLVNVYQNDDAVLMLVKLIQGGELYSCMKRHKRNILPERDAKFYASGIFEGLSYMHSYNIIYRDLKPENVLIHSDGYPVIVDLGFAKEVPDKTFTLCGTPWYIAPEVILGRGHDKACDHWSWAILVHEMVSGDTPFAASGTDQMTLFKAIVRGNYKISKRCNGIVSDLVERILNTKPSNRLGSLAGGEMDIKKHEWLVDVNFDKLRRKKFRAPWKPNVKDPLDVSQFDNWDHMAKDDRLHKLTAKEQTKFEEVNTIQAELMSRS